MATRKKATRKKATQRTPVATSSALVPAGDADVALYEGLFDPELTAGAETEGGGIAPFISTADGVFHRGEEIIGDTIECVVLGVSIDHALYPGEYVAGKRNNPICFYVGSKLEDAKPDPTATAPQHKDCFGCSKNAWGSGRGDAKACRQTRRLLILPFGPGTDVDNDQMYRVRIPPTSNKYVGQYYEKLKAFKRPFQALVTKLKIEGHKQNRFEIKITPESQLPTSLLEGIARRANEGRGELFSPPIADRGTKKGQSTRGGSTAGSGRRKVARRR